jgi:uncharacterized membrane protein
MGWFGWITLVLMAGLYVLAGLNHFREPEFYLKMMPPYLPAHAALVFLSGVAEVGLAAALLVPPLRPWAAWGLIALLIAVFPANLHVAIYNIALLGAEGAGWINWARLPLQLVLIAWAWCYTKMPASAPIPAHS